MGIAARSFVSKTWYYDPGTVADKERFHRYAARRARAVAKRLGLEPGTFDVRTNRGGPAVMDEAILHGERVYIQLDDGGSMGPDRGGVMYRICKGRKDYVGGTNHFLPVDAIDDPDRIAESVRKLWAREGTA